MTMAVHHSPTFYTSSRAAPLPFVSIDALALHLLRQRPGRRLELLSQDVTCDGDEPFAAVGVFALKPSRRMATALAEARTQAECDQSPHPLPLQDDWLGWACGGIAADPVHLQAAIDRMASAGGLAA